MFQLLNILQYLLIVNISYAFLYEKDNSLMFSSSSFNDYFGYSVLMQNGSPPRILIGAPRAKEKLEGAVWICPINVSNIVVSVENQCKSYTYLEKFTIRENNLFGASIDGGTNAGDPIMIGAPKYTLQFRTYNILIYSGIGGVYLESDLIRNDPRGFHPGATNDQQIKYAKYLSAFAGVGFSVHYVENIGDFLLGAPGYFHWSGNIYEAARDTSNWPLQVKQFEGINNSHDQLPTDFTLSMILQSFQTMNSLTGYAAASGRWSTEEIFYAIGSPKDNFQSGSVIIVSSNDFHPKQKISGTQFGEYFGSTVCVLDVNADGLDDLIVGAPTFSKANSYDNGRIYIFINDKKDSFTLKQHLDGEHSSRFGTSITNLGNFGLSEFNSIAVGAPYEDSKGAVYIFFGSPEGFQKFNKVQLDDHVGFGFSISKPVDIDKNGVVDIAVGTYKSGKVVVLKGNPMVYFDVDIISKQRLYVHLQQPSFVIKYCISAKGFDKLRLPAELVLDDRIINNVQRQILHVQKNYCHEQEVVFRQNIDRIEPLEVFLNITTAYCPECPVLSPFHSSFFTRYIPFFYDCGDDKFCEPDLTVRTSTDDIFLVVGEKNSLNLSTVITNEKEPAYTCKMDFHFNEGVSIARSPSQCEHNSCLLKHITQWESINMELDVRKIHLGYPEFLSVGGTINCVNYSTTFQSNIPLVYKYDFHVEGITKTIEYNSEENSKINQRENFLFNVENRGPSILKTENFVIKLPRKYKDTTLMKIYSINYDESLVTCWEDFKMDVETTVAEDDQNVQLASIIGVDVRKSFLNYKDSDLLVSTINCTIHSMEGGTGFAIKIEFEPLLSNIVKWYKNTFSIGVLFESSSGDRSESLLSYIDNGNQSEGTLLWIIIISCLIGSSVLALIVFAAYKFNFFRRKTVISLLESSHTNDASSDDIELDNQAAESEELEDMTKAAN